MKQLYKLLPFCLFLLGIGVASSSLAQSNSEWISEVDTAAIYQVKKFNGQYFVGKILRMDEREILMFLPSRGKLIIPSHEVQSIIKLEKGELDENGRYVDDHYEASQYILNTSSHGLKKGRVFVGSSLFGPDITVGLSEKLSVRFTTTWVAAPVMATLNYRIHIRENFSMQFGLMGGWASWFDTEDGMVLPFGAMTIGKPRNSFTITGGYGFINTSNTTSTIPYGALSGITQLNERWDLVFDSFISRHTIQGFSISGPFGFDSRPDSYEFNGSLALAARHTTRGGTFIQFGAGFFTTSGYFAPLPVLQVFHKFN